MHETEKIKFIGYNIIGEKVSRTISGVFDRQEIDCIINPSKIELLKYDFVSFSEQPNLEKEYKCKKLIIQIVTEDFVSDMIILLHGTAYVMNHEGNTIDVIRSSK